MNHVQIGPYRILSKLGEGGMGAVYEGIHDAIERRVAIKVLHAEFAQNPEFTARFFNEARAVNRVDHPGLVQVSDYGQMPDGTAYIVMEFLKGESLGSRLKSLGVAMSVDEAIFLSRQIADALANAHAKSIVHRDLKPDNIMIIPDSAMPGGRRTKLLDFGIAKLATAADQASLKTRTNAVMGTPVYMSPEQCRGAANVDDKSDVYSFGVLLYVMLSGRQPFNGEGIGEIMAKHIYEEPPPLGALVPWIPHPLINLVHSLLVKDKHQRPTMRKVAEALDELTGTDPGAAPHRSSSGIALRSAGRNVLFDHPSTLGLSAGQSQGTPTNWRRLIMGLLGAGGALTLTVGVPIWHSPQPRAAAQASVQPPRVAPAPRLARWSITSEPAGAEIIKLPDGQVVGRTPWTYHQPAQAGTAQLALRLPGYKSRNLTLNQEHDAALVEALEVIPPPPSQVGSARPRRSKALTVREPTLEQKSKSPAAPVTPAQPRPRVHRTLEE